MSLFSATALTLFPEMFPGPLGHSLAGTALKKGIWSLDAINIRDFATDKHHTVDASPYGGGVGMVMKPDVIDSAIEHAKAQMGNDPTIIYFTPRGTPLTQPLAQELSHKHLILLCGRFEGVDQRVIDHHRMLEISLGDFVLSGGEIAALALLDACVRLLPGVIGKEEAIQQESFANHADYAGLLEYPHYTRPPSWKGKSVPEILLSGNHKEIDAWRLEQAKEITALRRPDLLGKKKD
jgi:tRNA (guanine37-N1)-methyltransferase